MILDFKEIPQANLGSGVQDTFELFARDFLYYMGYDVVEHPDRGADGKKDIIVEETITGVSSKIAYRWLVSCKHYAHSGVAVKDSDEINIKERIEQHKCDGFMGFYSTICSTSLSGIMNNIHDAAGRKNTFVYDHEMIEQRLLRDQMGMRLATRYFPKSMEKYTVENPVPAQLFRDQQPLYCDYCGANLLRSSQQGIYCLLQTRRADDEDKLPLGTGKYKKMYFACKGDCDSTMKRRYKKMGYVDAGWDDLDDLCIPTIWIQKIFAFLNGIYDSQDMEDEAYKKMMQMFLRTYPYVARHLTASEKSQVEQMLQFGLLE